MTCSFAVRGALKKFAEVEKAEVSLNRGIASLTLRPGNKVKVTDLWDVVTRNGFKTKETKAVLRGEILSGGRQIKMPESGEVYTIVGRPTSGAADHTAKFSVTLKPVPNGVEVKIAQ